MSDSIADVRHGTAQHHYESDVAYAAYDFDEIHAAARRRRAMPIAVKSMLGVTILGVTMRFWPHLFQQYFSQSVAYAEQLLHLAR